MRTVKEVHLRERFLKRIVFVGDRGMLSEKSRQVLGKAGCGYLLGLPRRNRSEAAALLAEAQETPLESWTEVDRGRGEGVTRVVEVQSTREGVRCLVVHSQERLAYERAQREQRPRQRVLKKEAAIGAAAERILHSESRLVLGTVSSQ